MKGIVEEIAWITTDIDKSAGFAMLVRIPKEEKMWLLHGIPIRLVFKRYPSMGWKVHRQHQDGTIGDYLGYMYSPAKHLKRKAWNRVHPQVQDILYDAGVAP